MASKARSIAAE